VAKEVEGSEALAGHFEKLLFQEGHAALVQATREVEDVHHLGFQDSSRQNLGCPDLMWGQFCCEWEAGPETPEFPSTISTEISK